MKQLYVHTAVYFIVNSMKFYQFLSDISTTHNFQTPCLVLSANCVLLCKKIAVSRCCWFKQSNDPSFDLFKIFQRRGARVGFLCRPVHLAKGLSLISMQMEGRIQARDIIIKTSNGINILQRNNEENFMIASCC